MRTRSTRFSMFSCNTHTQYRDTRQTSQEWERWCIEWMARLLHFEWKDNTAYLVIYHTFIALVIQRNEYASACTGSIINAVSMSSSWFQIDRPLHVCMYVCTHLAVPLWSSGQGPHSPQCRSDGTGRRSSGEVPEQTDSADSPVWRNTTARSWTELYRQRRRYSHVRTSWIPHKLILPFQIHTTQQ